MFLAQVLNLGEISWIYVHNRTNRKYIFDINTLFLFYTEGMSFRGFAENISRREFSLRRDNGRDAQALTYRVEYPILCIYICYRKPIVPWSMHNPGGKPDE